MQINPASSSCFFTFRRSFLCFACNRSKLPGLLCNTNYFFIQIEMNIQRELTWMKRTLSSWVWSLVGQQKPFCVQKDWDISYGIRGLGCGCFPEYQIESIRLNWQRRESRALSLFLLLLRLASYTCHHTNMSPEIMSEHFPQWQIWCQIIDNQSAIVVWEKCKEVFLRLISYTYHYTVMSPEFISVHFAQTQRQIGSQLIARWFANFVSLNWQRRESRALSLFYCYCG